MTTKELYTKLTEAYSDKNLNRITAKLILLYKNRNYGKISEMANKISRIIAIDEENDARCFSRLIMLYHPDKGGQIRSAIERQYAQNDEAALRAFSHILLLGDPDLVVVEDVAEDVDYHPEYMWDVDMKDGFGYDDPDGDVEASTEVDYERSFYNLIKIWEYGDVSIEFPSYYLEDFEEFEMAYSGLESLDGVEYCIHAKVLDLSDNRISDIGNLWNLQHLEELYLGNNRIGFIDSLSNLTSLRVLDLSGNRIDDVSPLMNLENLELVNLIGNPVPATQIKQLNAKGIIVMTGKV
ncbi:leucine-rich repeat domain-containing protein [Saccharicrinis sp. FJH54]|uniref:leucine-rich repeat domain-containing protein n=1 Tax=Saccharicrinis sp. FJH54 TaxID=3344665 RepID=UPI0035D4B584